jgi:hypothetical protein
MSIEDIDYLYENSEKDNFILYVDSSNRNQDYFPKPNHYTINFDQPFKFVYGIDILDASIPSSMYNVEDDANGICGLTYLLNSTTLAQGYTFQKLLIELSEFADFHRLFYSKIIARQTVGGAESRTTGQIIVTNNFLLTSWSDYINNNNALIESVNEFYYVFVREEIKGLTIYPKAEERLFEYPTWTFTYKNIEYEIGLNPDDPNVILFLSLYNTGVYTFIFTPLEVYGQFDAIYYREYNVPALTPIRMRNSNVYMAFISTFYSEFTPGNYGATNFIEEGKKVFGGTGISLSGQSSSDISIRPKLVFTSEQPFVLNMDNSTAKTWMGFDEYAVSTMPKLYQRLIYRDNKRLFAPIFSPIDSMYRVIAPGVIYLLGTRYIILRCPEIESHLYASRAFGKFSPGIGMFKMYSVNDVAHQRFDFVNFHKKPFHPIGKLDRMTLRFEKPDGVIYDFKGANHLLLICIKYYVPTQKKKLTRSVLNPNYNYDFNSYLTRKIEYKENDDDEHHVSKTLNDNEFHKKYSKIENKYNYDSTTDEDDDHDDSSEDEDDNMPKFRRMTLSDLRPENYQS